MALRALTRKETGDRIAIVAHLSWMTHLEIAAAMGEPDDRGLVTRLCRGESRAIERIPQIANACTGQGFLKDVTPEMIAQYLRGELEDLNEFLTFPVGERSRKRYITPIPSDLGIFDRRRRALVANGIFPVPDAA